MSVCLLGYLKNHVQTSGNFMYITCGRDSVCLSWQWSTLYTSSFVDDVMFSHNKAVVYGEAYGQGMSFTGMQCRHRRSFSTSAPPVSVLPSADWCLSAVSLTIHNGVWLWKGTMYCAPSNSAILICLAVFDFSLFVAAQWIFIHIFYNLQSLLQSVVVLCMYISFGQGSSLLWTHTLSSDGTN